MKTKLTLSVNGTWLTKARRKLKAENRSISEAVDELLKNIAEKKEPIPKSWIEQFGDLRIPLDMKEAESDSWAGKHLRRTGAYKEAKATRKKQRS